MYNFNDVQDMGNSAWMPTGAATPLPLFNQTTVIEAPVDLSTITERYANWTIDFIAAHDSADAKPFFAMLATHNAHTPLFCGVDFCGTRSVCRLSIGLIAHLFTHMAMLSTHAAHAGHMEMTSLRLTTMVHSVRSWRVLVLWLH